MEYIEQAINHLKILRNLDTKMKEEIYNFIISILEEKINNNWISIQEKLPENKVRVLIQKSSGSISIGFCNVNYNEWREDGYILHSQPLAWQPLPQKYTEV